jgi:cardiolipin synthase
MTVLNWLAICIVILLSCFAAVHALLNKRNPSAALGWVAICLMFQPMGALLYFLFGINRVRTRARKLEGRPLFKLRFGFDVAEEEYPPALNVQTPVAQHPCNSVSDRVTGRPIVGGNRVEILRNGEEAYPLMLEAIRNAQKSVCIATYIFGTGQLGRRFIEALADAVKRGVDVRVLLDGIGEFYAFPRAGTLLKRKKVKIARFIPPSLFPPNIHINLRNHRKILVTDGQTGFMGGMNISDAHLASNQTNGAKVSDIHFRVQGPVVHQLEMIFLEDWAFCTGEQAVLSPYRGVEAGEAICRTIVDGPNEDLDKLAMILVGAISAAQHRVSIMTPYFLPSREIISALQIAALRGVEVEVILPSKNNLPFVHWATRNMLWEILQKGVRIYYQPPPFVHSKLFIVDDQYAQIGSANIDPRSLRLNFELALEIYGQKTIKGLADHVKECRRMSKQVFLKEMDNRPLPVRIRDAMAWLFSPYL